MQIIYKKQPLILQKIRILHFSIQAQKQLGMAWVNFYQIIKIVQSFSKTVKTAFFLRSFEKLRIHQNSQFFNNSQFISKESMMMNCFQALKDKKFHLYNRKTFFLIIQLNINMLTKEQIKNNREKIRKNMISCLVTVAPNIPIISLKNTNVVIQGQLIPQNNRKRRVTEDSNYSQKHQFLPEFYTKSSFEDHFQIGTKLGEGCQSVVYKCLQIESKQPYAVKKMAVADIERISTLKEQFKILKSIKHPNIIQAHYLFINECNQTVHLVCDHFDAPDLRTYIRSKKTIEQGQAAQIINSILKAISYLHKNGIAHRDLKPENILYNPKTKELKLIDFEIAKKKKMGAKTLSMLTNTGTLNYKAPEMFKSIYDEQIDIWAVGVILYEMVVGTLPFYSEFHKKTVDLITKAQPQYPQKLSPLSLDFLKRCLKKNPFQRNTAFEASKSPYILNNCFLQQMPSPLKKALSCLQTIKKEQIEDQTTQIKFFDENEKMIKTENIFTFKAGISEDYCLGIRCN